MSIFNKENLGFGFMGNGQVVWDRTIEENRDYKRVAFLQGKQNKTIKKGDEVDITIYPPNKQYEKELRKYFEEDPNIIIKSITNHKK